MSSNTPTLTQIEEETLNNSNAEPKEIKATITVSITMSKTMTVTINEGDENDDIKLLHAFDMQKYSPEQAKSFLEEYKHRKTINNIQTKINDLSGWTIDDKCAVLDN